MDLQKGEYIVYRNAGVCQVMDIEEQSMDGENTILPMQVLHIIFLLPRQPKSCVIR